MQQSHKIITSGDYVFTALWIHVIFRLTLMTLTLDFRIADKGTSVSLFLLTQNLGPGECLGAGDAYACGHTHVCTHIQAHTRLQVCGGRLVV